jgi:hypothetical protein
MATPIAKASDIAKTIPAADVTSSKVALTDNEIKEVSDWIQRGLKNRNITLNGRTLHVALRAGYHQKKTLSKLQECYDLYRIQNTTLRLLEETFNTRLQNYGKFYPKYNNKVPLLKVLDKNGNSVHGGRMKWSLPTNGKPGNWQEITGSMELCRSGLHLTNALSLDSWFSDGYRVFLAEVEGPALGEDRKFVVRKCRLIKELKYSADWWKNSPEYATAYIEALLKGLSATTKKALFPDDVIPTTTNKLKSIVAATKKVLFNDAVKNASTDHLSIDYNNNVSVRVGGEFRVPLRELTQLESDLNSGYSYRSGTSVTPSNAALEKYLGLENFDMAKFLEATPEPLPLPVEPEVTE